MSVVSNLTKLINGMIKTVKNAKSNIEKYRQREAEVANIIKDAISEIKKISA